MRTEFTENDLLDSNAYYHQFFEAIQTVSIPYLSGTKHKKIGDYYAGALFYSSAFNLITTYNRVSTVLIDMGEILVGAQLIRNILDLLTAIYADTIWPFQILYQIYMKGKEFGEIKRDNKYINQGALRKEIDAKFGTNISQLYQDYSTFLHPNINQSRLGIDPSKPKWDLLYKTHLVYINQTIGNILSDFINNINSKISEYEK